MEEEEEEDEEGDNAREEDIATRARVTGSARPRSATRDDVREHTPIEPSAEATSELTWSSIGPAMRTSIPSYIAPIGLQR